jgi:putative heme-binding domain-containing protein
MGPAGVAKVLPWLDSTDETQRLVAYRALRRANHDVLAMAAKMAGDKSAAVRREVALTLRDVPAEKSVPLLVKIAGQFDGRDRAYIEAFGLGSEGKEREVYATLEKTMGGDPAKWSDAFAWIAWRLHPVDAVPALKARALSTGLGNDQRKLMLTALAFVPAREAAGAMLDIARTKDFPHADLAKWWLLNRKGNDWQAFDVDAGMKALGIYDPEKMKLTAVEMPSVPENAPQLPPAVEIAKIPGDAARGRDAATVCQACHRIGSTGVDFGPDLTAFGKQQTREVIAQALANPSAEISHGFEGSTVKTKDGLTITGMVLSDGDPLLIKCMGGLVQTVPRSRIESVKPLGRSLMYDASQLGLDAQRISDIAAYLKSL